MGVPGTFTRININGESKKNPNLSLSLSPYPLSSLLTLDLCSITATFSPSLSLSAFSCYSCGSGMDVSASRRFYLYGGANHPRLRGVEGRSAKRSGQMARTKRRTREGTSGGQFVSHFISGLGHPSADSPPPPCGRHRERGFYFDPWWGLVNLRRRPAFSADLRE